MKVRKADILLSVAALAFTVVALEILLRMATVTAFQLVNPGFFGEQNYFEFHPRLEYTLRRSHARNISYRDDDGSMRTVAIVTSAAGIRDAVPEEEDRPLIAFVGDSFTEGYHVDSFQAYPALVRRALGGRRRTVNLGVHNYNCVNYYKMALFARETFAADAVFVGLYVGNDVLPYNRWSYKPPPDDPFHALRIQLKSSLYLYAWLEGLLGGKRIPTSAGEPPALSAIADFFDDFDDVECPADTVDQYIRDYTAYRQNDEKMERLYADPWQMFLTIKATVMVLDDLRRELRETRLHVLIIPERVQVRDEEWEWLHARFPKLYKHRYLVVESLKRELTARGIAFTDLLPLLDRSSYLRFDGHFSEEGHRRVAAVVQVLARR